MKKKILGACVVMAVFASGYFAGQTVKVGAQIRAETPLQRYHKASEEMYLFGLSDGKDGRTGSLDLMNAIHEAAADRKEIFGITAGKLNTWAYSKDKHRGNPARISQAAHEVQVTFSAIQIAQNQRIIELLEENNKK